MYQVGICGHFAEGKDSLDGQTVKTKTFSDELQNQLGKEKVTCIDTFGWKQNSMRLVKQSINLFRNSKNVVILPNQNGLKIFVPLFLFLNKLFNRKIFYVVIGGWLPVFLKRRSGLLKRLQKFDGIFVETSSMKEKLSELGLNNVSVMPNFKHLKVLKCEDIYAQHSLPLKLCTFSRVLKEKGIEDAINAVIKVNTDQGKEVFTLDIFGQIDEKYSDDFKDTLSVVPHYIKYKGMVPYEKSVDILKDYYLLLFPTYYEGEGFAGTLLDAMASGVPVIASDWRYNSEIIEDGKNGRIFPVKEVDALIDILKYYVEQQEEVYEMRKQCIVEANKYTPSVALNKFINVIDK